MSGRADRRQFPALAILAVLVAGLLLALRSSGNQYGLLLNRARLHAKRAERTDAVAAYRAAVRYRPEDPRPYLEMARVYLAWGRHEEALDALAQAEGLGANGAKLTRLRLLVHKSYAESIKWDKEPHWDAVVGSGQRLLHEAQEDREAQSILGEAYLALREWGAARAVYEEILLVDPDDAVARERLGALTFGYESLAGNHLRRSGTALSEELALALETGEVAKRPADLHAAAGRILVKYEEWALAARQLGRAVAYGPDDAESHAYLGHALGRMGYRAEAEAHLLKAVELAPSSVVAHTFLGLHYDRRGDTSEARAEYEAAYDLAPRNPALCVEIGQTWVAERRNVVAELWLREAVSLKPDDPALWEVLVRFYLDHAITTGDRAVEAAIRLLELAPDSAVAHDLRGWAAFHEGEYQTAEEHLERAITLDEGLASAYYHLALLRQEQGREREAHSAFDRAVDLDTSGDLVPLVARAR